jgi:hypothetical protein
VHEGVIGWGCLIPTTPYAKSVSELDVNGNENR